MDNIRIFCYNGAQVRTVDIEGEVWFVAKDVCDILGLTNTTVALESLDEDDRSKFFLGRSPIHGGGGEANIINEPGLYALILRSNKPEAKSFSRWVRHDVLPAIRKTGKYETPTHRKIRPIPALPDEAVSAVPALPAHSGVIKAAEKIIDKAFHCEDEADFKAVIALDKVFQESFGRSVLEIAGLKLVKVVKSIMFTAKGMGWRDDKEEISYKWNFGGNPDDPDTEYETEYRKGITPDWDF